VVQLALVVIPSPVWYVPATQLAQLAMVAIPTPDW
jgi:hypothetical protein